MVDSEASPSPSQQDEDVIGNTLDDETGWTDEDLSDGYIRDAQQGFKDRHPDLQLVQTEFVPGTAHPTVPYPRREATAPPRKKTWETDSNWRDRS